MNKGTFEKTGEKAVAKHIGAAALLLAVAMLLARLLGYGREVLLAYLIGAGKEADAYIAAFTIADLLNYLLAGSAFSLALIPLYTLCRESQGHQKADAFLSTVLGTLGGITVVVTALLFIFAAPLVDFMFDGFDAPTRALTTRLMRIVLPAQIFFILGGVIKAGLLARGRFFAAAAAPVLYNVCIILGGACLGPWIGVEGFAWGVLIGACIGPLGAPCWDAMGRMELRPRFAPLDRGFLKYLLIAAPLMLGISLLTVDDLYLRVFGSDLAEGTVARLNYARKLMLLPVGLVGQSVATAAMPVLSQLYSEKRHDELNRILDGAMKTGLVLSIVCTAGVAAFALPATLAVYRHGALTHTDALEIASVLTLLSAAIPAWILQQIQTRAFYARSDTWRPMLLGTGIAVLMFPLYSAMGRDHGALGLAFAGVLGVTLSAMTLMLWARLRHGVPMAFDLAIGAIKMGPIAACAALIGRRLGDFMASALFASHPVLQTWTTLIVGGLLFGLIAGLGLYGFGGPEIRNIIQNGLKKMPWAKAA